MKTHSIPSILIQASGLSVGIIIIGALFKFLHFPYGTIILLVGLLLAAITCLCWLPQLKKSPLYTKVEQLRDTPDGLTVSLFYSAILVALVSVAVLCVGIIFRMMHYPGASMIIMCSALALACCAISFPTLLINYKKHYEE